jgi:hypothetical protein
LFGEISTTFANGSPTPSDDDEEEDDEEDDEDDDDDDGGAASCCCCGAGAGAETSGITGRGPPLSAIVRG